MYRIGFRLFFFALLVLYLGQWRLHRQDEETHCALQKPFRRVGNRSVSRLTAPESGLRCLPPGVRNPGAVADGRLFFRPVVAPPVAAWRKRLRENWARSLEQVLAPFEGLRALSQAVWLGEAKALPGAMSQLYREGGLLHLLALSGAHIGSLWLLLQGGLALLAPWANRSAGSRVLFGFLHQGPVLLLAAWLTVLNPGNEPLARASTMFFFHRLLAWRGKQVSGIQLLCSSSAFLLLMRPERVASDSFLLSTAATFFLCVWIMDDKKGNILSQYLSLSFALPLLLLPCGAFFFAKFPVMAAINGVLIGWLWTLIWVPLGFVVAVAIWLPPFFFHAIFMGAEASWQGFVASQTAASPWIGWGYVSVLRPSWLELGCLETFLLLSLAGARRMLQRGALSPFMK